MADLQPIQASFQSGEISPRLRGRVQSDRYATGLEVCENFLPRSQGPLELRSGFEHSDEFTGTDGVTDVRLIPLEIDDDTRFVIAIGGDHVKVYDESGAVLGGQAGINLIFNGDFDQALLGWSTETAGPRAVVEWLEDEFATRLYVDHSNDRARLGQAVNVTTIGEYYCALTGVRPVGTQLLTVKVGTAFNDDTYGSVTIEPTGSGTIVGPFNVTATGQTWLTFELGDGSGECEWVVDKVRMAFVDASAMPVEFANPWAGFELWNLAFEQHPTTSMVLFAHPNVPAQELILTGGNIWILRPTVFTSAPAAWSGTNHPGALTFGEGRLWYGGTPAEPNRFWGSKSDDYFNFTQGTNADDSVEFTLAKRGRIVWMAGAKNLVLGTKLREWIVTGGAGGVISPGNVDASPQSAYGSFAGQKVDIGERILYVSGGERKLRSMGYEWQQDAWISVDLAWPSEHITKGRIQDMVFQSDPVQILWMQNRADGDLIACAYDREQKVVGWARCPTPGRVLALAATEFFGISEVWAIVQYDIEGVKKNYIERIDPLEPAFMDSHVHRVLDTNGDKVSGLEHLEGRTVKVLVNGATHPDRVVVDGDITLQTPTPYAEVLVGLGYRGRAKTLPLEGGSPKGTQQGRKKRYSRIWVRLESSSLPHINGQVPPDRTADAPMDARQPPWSEDVQVRNFSWDRTAQVEVIQDVPLATTIIGIFGEVQANG